MEPPADQEVEGNYLIETGMFQWRTSTKHARKPNYQDNHVRRSLEDIWSWLAKNREAEAEMCGNKIHAHTEKDREGDRENVMASLFETLCP